MQLDLLGNGVQLKAEKGAGTFQLVMCHWDAKLVASAEESVNMTAACRHVWPVKYMIIIKVVDQVGMA